MRTKRNQVAHIVPLNPIRIEKELSKFPIHNLSKRGSLNIDLRGKDRAGKEFRWSVSPSRDYGEPKELAYRLDTLLINRRIDAAGRIKPKVIRLGSLRSICRELRISEGCWSDVKRALLQNASTFITAKLLYSANDGTDRTLEAAFTRYSVIMTGETLPNGKVADAVYILLNDVYREVLNSAGTRPLDYDYLEVLTPTAQRFYELVSPQIFAALKHHLPFAKYSYSDFCRYSAITRYFEARKAKKQLYPILKQHKTLGYLLNVTFDEFTDSQGELDWWMCLTPGPRAQNEFKQFSKRGEGKGTSESPFPISNPELVEGEETTDEVKELHQTYLWDLLKSSV